MRPIFPALAGILLLSIPALADGGPYVADDLLVGPNLLGVSSENRYRFEVQGGETVGATLTWDTSLGSLRLMLIHEGDGRRACGFPGDPPECLIEEMNEQSVESCDGELGDDAPLAASLVTPSAGLVYVEVQGLLSARDVPYRVTIAVDGGSPGEVNVRYVDVPRGVFWGNALPC